MRLDSRPKHHLINIQADDTPIYRIMEVHHLFELFENKQLVLVSPKLWEDPYEDFLNHCHGVDPHAPNIKISYKGYEELLFGQCWTFNKDNDYIWRVYSPNKNRVKIKTTINKLYQCLCKTKQEFFKAYLGKVNYFPESEIKDNITAAIQKDIIGYINLVLNFYLKKRDTFKEEKEVRLMVRLHKEKKYSNACFQDADNHNICRLPIDNPLEIIEEIVFDPRMPNSLVKAYKNHLINTFKFNGDCRKSNIYDSPNLKIEVDNEYIQTNLKLIQNSTID